MSFFGEIKRRKAVQATAIYLVVAWLIVQAIDVVSGPLMLPDSFGRIVTLLLIAGFPVAGLLGWMFDISLAENERDGDRSDR